MAFKLAESFQDAAHGGGKELRPAIHQHRIRCACAEAPESVLAAVESADPIQHGKPLRLRGTQQSRGRLQVRQCLKLIRDDHPAVKESAHRLAYAIHRTKAALQCRRLYGNIEAMKDLADSESEHSAGAAYHD